MEDHTTIQADETMKLWDAVKQPPESALKKIGGGRLKGMTDISPQWRYEAITKQFGPCGLGWFYTITKTWTEDGNAGEICVFAEVSLQVCQFSHAVTGIGGSKLIMSESSGLRTNDEAYKMAVTDALSVAFKMLGFGANIYAGKSEGSGSKYPTSNDSGNSSGGTDSDGEYTGPPKDWSDMPECPECHKSGPDSPVRKDKKTDGQYYCWNKSDKGINGCGHVFTSGSAPTSTPAPAEDIPVADREACQMVLMDIGNDPLVLKYMVERNHLSDGQGFDALSDEVVNWINANTKEFKEKFTEWVR